MRILLEINQVGPGHHRIVPGQATLLGERFLRLVNLFNESEGKPSDYGTGALLTRAEIHSVEAVGNHGGLSVTALASVMGTSKSAASQIVSRLKAKGLVTQTYQPGSDRDTVLNLTEAGAAAFRGHREFHSRFFHELEAGLEALDPESVKTMLSVFELAATLMKKRNQ